MAVPGRAIDTTSIFNKAEELLEQFREQEAFELYADLCHAGHLAPLAYYRMGEILNRQGKIEESLNCHRTAFQCDIHLARGINETDHPLYDYKYGFVEQTNVTCCPICGEEGTKHSCYNAVTSPHFTPGFDPIRLWMRCDSCNHIFAANYPTDLNSVLRGTSHNSYLKPDVTAFPALGAVLAAIKPIAPGRRLLDVGVRAGEMLAVAKEFLFYVTGVDIRPAYSKVVSEMLDVPVHAMGLIEFESEEPFDVICMGSVVEHSPDPIKMMRKAISLLSSGGVLWISTPNFESAHARVMKDDYPMWRACEHLNYFCYRSMKSMLESMGATVVNYAISNRHEGAMEVTAVRHR